MHPLRIYSIFDKKTRCISTRREDSRPRWSGVLRKIEDQSMLAVHTFRQGDEHTDVV